MIQFKVFFFHLALSQPLFPVCDKSLLSVANYLKCLNIQGGEKKIKLKEKKNPWQHLTQLNAQY